MTHILEADNIQFHIRGRVVLSDIYIRCETNKITGLLGRNGTGKSSLMNIIYGSLANEKSIRINNSNIHTPFKHRELLTFLPQFNFIPGPFTLKRVFSDYNISYDEFLEVFDEFKNKYNNKIRSLSGGERRLVETYIILCSSSQFSILDEPFTHLNPLQIEKVKQLLLRTKARKGLLITDHMYQHVLDISDDVLVLSDGRISHANDRTDLEKLRYIK